MTQRQLFQAIVILFSIYLCIDGFRLFIDILPKLVPLITDSLTRFYKKGGWPLPSASYILPLLLPSFITLGLAGLAIHKASDLGIWLFPEASNSPLIFHLQPDEWLRWGITLFGIVLLGWIAIPALLSTIFNPVVLNFVPFNDKGNSIMAAAGLHDWYWSFLIVSIGQVLIQGSFGLVCLLYAPRLAAWIIRIQKHPNPPQSQ